MGLASILAEALRRTQWALIRVENEFYNNFEKYRTFITIPNLFDEIDKQPHEAAVEG